MLEPLVCSQCGAPYKRGVGKCEYCDTEFVDRDVEARLMELDGKIQSLYFEISAAEMASAVARCAGGSGGHGFYDPRTHTIVYV